MEHCKSAGDSLAPTPALHQALVHELSAPLSFDPELLLVHQMIRFRSFDPVVWSIKRLDRRSNDLRTKSFGDQWALLLRLLLLAAVSTRKSFDPLQRA